MKKSLFLFLFALTPVHAEQCQITSPLPVPVLLSGCTYSGSLPNNSTSYIQNTLSPTTTTQVFTVETASVSLNAYFPYLTAGQCLTTDSSGLLGTTSCGSGGGGGSSSLSVGGGTSSQYTFQASSPTAIINFSTAAFLTSLQGSATAFITPNPSSVTLQGLVTAASLGALTGNQTITLSGDASGSGATSINVTNSALQGNIKSFSSPLTFESSTTAQNVTQGTEFLFSGPTPSTVTFGLTVGTLTVITPSGINVTGGNSTGIMFQNGQALTNTSTFEWNGTTMSATATSESSNTVTTYSNVTGANGENVKYGINIGSMTGAGLSSCSGAANALTWSNSTNQFGCNTISGGSGGSSTLGMGLGTATQNTVLTSSPTALFNANNSQFIASQTGGATFYFALNPSSVTLQGNTFNGTNELIQTNSNGGFSLTGTPVSVSGFISIGTSGLGTIGNIGYNSSSGGNFLINAVNSLELGTGGFNNDLDILNNGNVTIANNLSLGTVSGAGLVSCSGSSNALTWNSSTNDFGCNTISAGSSLGMGLGTSAQNTVLVSSPTALFNANSAQFTASQTGGATFYFALNPSSATLQGPIVSSITLSAMYGAPTLTGTNFTALPGAQVGSGVPAANIAAGALGSSVIASSLTASGVTAGSYTNSNITVNAEGQITSASNGSGGSGASWPVAVSTGGINGYTGPTISSPTVLVLFDSTTFKVSLIGGATAFVQSISTVTGSGSPGGSSGQLQYNSGGTFAGDANSVVTASSESFQGSGGVSVTYGLTMGTFTATGVGTETIGSNASLNVSVSTGLYITDGGNNYTVLPSTAFVLAASTAASTTGNMSMPGMAFSIPANETWGYQCYVYPTGAVGGLKLGVNGPSGATVRGRVQGSSSATGYQNYVVNTLNTVDATGVCTASTCAGVQLDGEMTTSSTSGTWQLIWQAGTSGDSITINPGSYCRVERLL